MKRVPHVLSVSTVIAVVAASALVAEPVSAQVRGRSTSGRTRVEGTVVDHDGKPLQGVVIRLENQNSASWSEDFKSNKKGKFSHPLVQFGEYKFYFEKEGYKIYFLRIENRASDEGDMGSFGPLHFNLADQDHRTLKLAPSGLCTIELRMAPEKEFERMVLEAAESGELPADEGGGEITRKRHPAEIGREMYDLKNYQAALDNFMEALALEGGAEDPNLYFAIGRCQYEMKQYDQALQSFQRVEELSKEPRPGLHFYQAQIVHRQGRTREATLLLEQELEVSGSDSMTVAAVMATLGSLYRDLGDSDKAIEWLVKAVEMDPTNLNALLTLGTLYNAAGKQQQSERYFEMAVEAGASAGQEGAVVFFNLGALNFNQGEYRTAAEAYERAVSLRPSYAAAHRELGYTYRELSEYRKASEHFQKYLELQPQAAERQEIETWMKAVASVTG
jgi:tetratricopeptide (TPR) repeat protein